MNYDAYLSQCVEDYFDPETPDVKQERIESHEMQYDEWRDFCAEQNILQAENAGYWI